MGNETFAKLCERIGYSAYPDEWLDFVEIEEKPKTKVYAVISKASREVLGKVKWYPSWRNYCFFPTLLFETVHSDRCLLSISKFVTKLNDEHKKKSGY